MEKMFFFYCVKGKCFQILKLQNQTGIALSDFTVLHSWTKTRLTRRDISVNSVLLFDVLLIFSLS